MTIETKACSNEQLGVIAALQIVRAEMECRSEGCPAGRRCHHWWYIDTLLGSVFLRGVMESPEVVELGRRA